VEAALRVSKPGQLLKRQAVRKCRTGAECRVEVYAEARVKFDIIAFHASYMHDVIALRVHLA
jgi:hypothetical protein